MQRFIYRLLIFSIGLCPLLCHTILLTNIILQYSVKLGSRMRPALFFFRVALTIKGLLLFHMIFFPVSVKNDIGILKDIALSVYRWLWVYEHFNDTLLIHDHRQLSIYLCLLQSLQSLTDFSSQTFHHLG